MEGTSSKSNVKGFDVAACPSAPSPVSRANKGIKNKTNRKRIRPSSWHHERRETYHRHHSSVLAWKSSVSTPSLRSVSWRRSGTCCMEPDGQFISFCGLWGMMVGSNEHVQGHFSRCRSSRQDCERFHLLERLRGRTRYRTWDNNEHGNVENEAGSFREIRGHTSDAQRK